MKKPLIAVVLALSTSAGCSSSSDDAPSGGTTKNEITVTSNKFEPAALTVKVNETVTWKWGGGFHNVVSGANCTPDGAYTSGNPVNTVGNVFTRAYDKPGKYEFYCNPHCAGSGMKGVITVE